jgi:hypothetical protein
MESHRHSSNPEPLPFFFRIKTVWDSTVEGELNPLATQPDENDFLNTRLCDSPFANTAIKYQQR